MESTDITKFYMDNSAGVFSHQLVGSKNRTDIMVNDLSIKRFKDKLSGRGILVRKISSEKVEFIPRTMRYMGKYLYISSLTENLEIHVGDIINCTSIGRILEIKTRCMVISVKMPSMTDAIAVRNVLGNGLFF